MKKILVILTIQLLLISCCIIGIGTVASAVEESPAEDFLVYEGILEEYIGPGGDVVIPASLGVKEIGAQAFYENLNITSVVIPEGVEVIGEQAFSKCESIEKLTLPYSLEEIGTHAFSRVAITELTIPGKVEVVGYGAFVNCNYLTDLTLSYGVVEILPLAFSLSAVERVVFPETVELICGSSFSNNVNTDARRFEWIICNSNCEITSYADTARKSFKHEWVGNTAPWCDNKGDREHKIVVPSGSNLEKSLQTTYTPEWLKANSDSGKSDTYKVVSESEKYFEELEENQEGYGTQKPGEDGKNTLPGYEENTNNKDNSSNQNSNNNESNNQNNNSSSNNTYSGSVNNSNNSNSGRDTMSMTLIIVVCVFGGVMVIAIIAVVILAASGKLFGGTKKNNEKKVDIAEFEAMKAKLEELSQKEESAESVED